MAAEQEALVKSVKTNGKATKGEITLVISRIQWLEDDSKDPADIAATNMSTKRSYVQRLTKSVISVAKRGISPKCVDQLEECTI